MGAGGMLLLGAQTSTYPTATTRELIHPRRPGKPLPARAQGSQAARRYLESLVEAHEERLARELNLIEYRQSNTKEE